MDEYVHYGYVCMHVSFSQIDGYDTFNNCVGTFKNFADLHIIRILVRVDGIAENPELGRSRNPVKVSYVVQCYEVRKVESSGSADNIPGRSISRLRYTRLHNLPDNYLKNKRRNFTMVLPTMYVCYFWLLQVLGSGEHWVQ